MAAFRACFHGFVSREFFTFDGAIAANSRASLGDCSSQRTVASPEARGAQLQTADAKLETLAIVLVPIGYM